jgi:hypothetical protein
MMTVYQITGIVASTLVLLTFLTKDIRLLRTFAIMSNFAFIAYGVLGSLWPVLCLHLLLLPVNVTRLMEMHCAGGRSICLWARAERVLLELAPFCRSSRSHQGAQS